MPLRSLTHEMADACDQEHEYCRREERSETERCPERQCAERADGGQDEKYARVTKDGEQRNSGQPERQNAPEHKGTSMDRPAQRLRIDPKKSQRPGT